MKLFSYATAAIFLSTAAFAQDAVEKEEPSANFWDAARYTWGTSLNYNALKTFKADLNMDGTKDDIGWLIDLDNPEGTTLMIVTALNDKKQMSMTTIFMSDTEFGICGDTAEDVSAVTIDAQALGNVSDSPISATALEIEDSDCANIQLLYPLNDKDEVELMMMRKADG